MTPPCLPFSTLKRPRSPTVFHSSVKVQLANVLESFGSAFSYPDFTLSIVSIT